MSSIPTTQINAEEEVSQPSGPRRGNRGKGSYQRNQDKIRAKKGAEFNKANRARIEEKCFLHLTDLTSSLSQISIDKVKTVKELPVTTRGIGFAVEEVYSKGQMLVPQDFCTKYALYRGSLAQLELQVQVSARSDVGLETAPIPKKQNCDKYRSCEQVILSNPRNFGPLTMIINQYGNFSAFNTDFQTFIPTPFIEHKDLVKTDVQRIRQVPKLIEHEIDPSPDAPTPAKRVVQEAIIIDEPYTEQILEIQKFDLWVPDPYVTTLSNLRRTVKFLADPGTPRAYRQYYLDRNPIPGAIWNEDYRLLNADEIMPPRYDPLACKRDFDAIAGWIAKFKGKYAFVEGTCHYDGKGNVNQLMMQRVSGRISRYLEISTEDYFASENIPNVNCYAGAYSLAGEVPDECCCAPNFSMRPPDLYGIRHHSNAGFILNLERYALASMLIK